MLRRLMMLCLLSTLFCLATHAQQVKHEVADWCTVYQPKKVQRGETLQSKVALGEVKDNLKFKTDLHWRDKEGQYMGFYQYGCDPQSLNNKKEFTITYRIKPRADEIGSVIQVIYLSPTGNWKDKTHHATASEIQVVQDAGTEQEGQRSGMSRFAAVQAPPKDLKPFVPEKHREINPYRQWENGPDKSADYFPLGVWLQDPRLAQRYKEAGINFYIGLWKGPTEKQLAQLKKAGMPVICHQNEIGLNSPNNDIIIGWMHGDEPDNAKPVDRVWNNDVEAMNNAWPGISREQWAQYGPPIPPKKIVADYKEIKENDPTRPVHLQLSQGVAWDGWVGRGVRTNHPEDYPKYIEGCDQVSFDIYPAVSQREETRGKLWLVAEGTARLLKWSDPDQPVWTVLEASRISNPSANLTPEVVRAEVWMSIIFGTRGIVYFVHQFKPTFNEDSLLDDPELLAGITRINREVQSLARVINGPTIFDGASVETSDPRVPIEIMVKKHEGATYVFSVAMNNRKAAGTFHVKEVGNGTAEVVGEDREIAVKDGTFTDEFDGYGVHLYRIR